ncbi:DUF2384 domain-containing protein [Deferribacter autotrophicus]|uniref:DUF2384 domain-containing protein n=1 Tax=Deferribacter autotrophicus TaxID=500465 RepID=A0A5A8F4I0_9BACT|nr:MbcA/ParS/Xre antitoxin family protein [Deferribacter autotrophicus]KAA0259044.1 DUF2384 domain-containing protein [Deferribacter autotrophicus]
MLANREEFLPEHIDPKKLNHVALKSFFNICEKWGIKSYKDQMTLLGLTSKSTFYEWKKNLQGNLSKDTLERISYILGIYKALQILLPYSANEWIKTKNPIFDDRTPLEIMLKGRVADLYIIKRYLDAERGSLYD